MTTLLVILLAAVTGLPEPTPRTLRVLTPSWEVPVPGTAVPLVTAMESGFAVATREGRISGHRLDTGERLWENDLAAPLAAPPVFIDGKLAVAIAATPAPFIVLLDHLTGLDSGRVTLGEGDKLVITAVKSGLALTGVFSGAPGARLHDPNTGALVWQTPLASPAGASVAQCSDTILVGGADGVLTGLSVTDGSTRWTRKLPGPITTPAVCNGSWLWVGSADNRIHALKMGRRSCRRRWSYPTGGDIAGRIILFNERVSFLSYDTYLYSLAEGNGHLQWKVRLGRRPQTDSVLVGDVLVLAQLNTERLEFFSLADGTPTASLTLVAGGERFVTPPARAGQMVVIGAARYGEESARIIGVSPLVDLPPVPAPSAPR